MFEGELGSKMENTFNEETIILSHERIPWNRKQVFTAKRLPLTIPLNGKCTIAFELANKLLCWPRPCRKFIVHSTASRGALPSQIQPKAMERALLVNAAFC